MLIASLVRHNTSSFSSSILLVKNKGGTWRFCIDYIALNTITIKDTFPVPNMDELLDEMHGSKLFTELDLRSEYYQMLMHKDDIHYEFVAMPFDLSNALVTFQATMKK